MITTPYDFHLYKTKHVCGVFLDINAKKSLQDSSINININLNYKEIGSLAESFIIKTWQEEWNTRKGSHHHNIQPLVNRPLITTLPTNKNKILTRLRVGVVAGLGDMGFKIHKINSPDCQVCHSKDTVSHFLLECRKYDSERGTLLTELASLGLNLTISNLLSPQKDSREAVTRALFSFLDSTKMVF